MNNNFTLAGKSIIIITILILLSNSSAKALDTLQVKKADQINTTTTGVFNAEYSNNSVSLNWSAKASVTNDHFEVERSFDEADFSTAAFVLGAQSENNGIEKYSFKDKDKRIAGQSTIYYRLKQVDINGNIIYSSVRKVTSGK